MSSGAELEMTGIRGRLRHFLEGAFFQRFIMTVIVVNGISLGLETSETVVGAIGPALHVFDTVALTIYVVEIVAKLFAYGPRDFVRNPWNIFDFIIVGVTLIPNQQGLAVLRALRILRALRLVSVVPSMRMVVMALFRAIPGMGSVTALLLLVFYIASVMATKLFAEAFPDWFGTVGASFYTLFQVMTLESWSMGIVRPVMDVFPYAWLFFIPFILITTFAVLNLFIAIVVNAMTEAAEPEVEKLDDEHLAVMAELKALREEIAAFRSEQAKR